MNSKSRSVWNFIIIFIVVLTIFLYVRIYIEDRSQRKRIDYSRRLSVEMRRKKPGSPLVNYSNTGVGVLGSNLLLRNPLLTQQKSRDDFYSSFSGSSREKHMKELGFTGVTYSDKAGENYWRFNFDHK